ncbi:MULTISPECIES: Lrp/AsnC family transcriptional regulator [Aeromonas]|jgi:Lrp/AsnC family leucine-responsive transcriptional regulator|uniref:Lrp/AsnC family transcriptional regulator n=1 Tax=Aeromonas media TaxID=651 RepID=A0AAE7ADL0_AERME|nr:Lrp/AsnC family transcriptional regulator [Aeromonas media]MBS4638660.1 Lrp/AsnC family transcriptional regulator [Aeromonas media]MCY9822254.1 Lrp/AsnC family transcriptional regulator [Aeromonas media]MCY9837195.1 Lrp/AsnC family transcriptional regulator [Aeromonas media]MDM5077582.1 Lrp/AsnC family transcriptional regulator [Aeromonas media]QJT29212.1 Lrp/AsnC family transcriptional regulator [Aeromonas media]
MTDKFDLLILAELQQDARLPTPELAHRVGLSAPACYRRVRALRESGLIEREVALVAPATMGWPITMLVLVTLERDHGRIVDEMIGVLKGEPEVMDLWYVTGEQDFVLQVAARDMASYEQFTRRVLHAREQVRSFKTLVVMGQHKRCGALLPG